MKNPPISYDRNWRTLRTQPVSTLDALIQNGLRLGGVLPFRLQKTTAIANTSVTNVALGLPQTGYKQVIDEIVLSADADTAVTFKDTAATPITILAPIPLKANVQAPIITVAGGFRLGTVNCQITAQQSATTNLTITLSYHEEYEPIPLNGLVLAFNANAANSLWQDDGQLTLAVSTNPVGRIDSQYEVLLPNLPYLNQINNSLRPVVTADSAGRLEVKSDGTTTYLNLTKPVLLSGDCCGYFLASQTNYSTPNIFIGGPNDRFYFFSDNTANLTAANHANAVNHGAILKGDLLVRFRRASGTAYVAGKGTTGVPGDTLADVSMGALAGTIRFDRILETTGVFSDATNAVGQGYIWNRDLSAEEHASVQDTIYGSHPL